MQRRLAQCLLALFVSGFALAADAPRIISSRELVLDLLTGTATTVTAADLYVSTDAGRTWTREPTPQLPGALRYTAPADGRYDFFVVLHNAAGASAPAPLPGTRPTVSVQVDTTPPLVQIHGVETCGPPLEVLVAATLIEEHLAEDAVRVFFRSDAAGAWRDGGPARRLEDGRLRWVPPEESGGTLELRVVATDRAGNPSAAEIVSVQLPAPPTTQPAAPAPSTCEPAAELPQPASAVAAPPEAAAGEALATTSQGAAPEVAHLREMAKRFMRGGQYALAAARYEDALALAPGDPDLLVDLGSALYRLNRYAEADTRFDAALAAAPEHVNALEGRALVAATQKRYAQAREHLQRLQQLQPDSASVWLRSGDIEHKLGHVEAARAAWERVLQASVADPLLRAKAQRRLDYFSVTAPPAAPAGDETIWPANPPPPRPSSSSTETNSTRRAPR